MRTSTPPFQLHPLNSNFVGPKPIEEVPLSTILELESADHLLIERKRRGHCTYISVTGPHCRYVDLYSSGIHELTKKFPNIVDEVRGMSIPNDTLLVGEMVLTVNGIDSDSAFGQIALSNPARAAELQRSRAPVQLALFNVIVHKGKSVIGLPYADRLDILRELTARHRVNNVDIVEMLDVPHEQAMAIVLEREYEGLVLYDKRASSAYRLDGAAKPPRPDGCWKEKPYKEGDFIATGWVPSTSKTYKGLVKDLLIAQYDPVTKELVSWGKVGVGLTAAQRREFANDKLYPMVFEVKFEYRTPNSRLISARIERQRIDKTPRECFSPHKK